MSGDIPKKSNASPARTDAKDSASMPATRKSSTKDKAAAKADESGWFNRISELTSSALKIAKLTTDSSIRVGKTILKNQDQLKLMAAAGQSLKDMREVAGLTIHELSDSLSLKDKSLWEAVENGTATISFELILRLAALLARNDPVPFILKYTRTYNPELWRILNDWGLGRLPLQYERERKFINIYRRHDSARQLSDEGFDKVLEFTQKAFEMGLHFVADNEQLSKPNKDAKQAEKSTSEDSHPPHNDKATITKPSDESKIEKE
ncbi:XRE family transcriptional regulator [Hahella aquimaris]|uniref:XRE family transcriptional regulator n=1 Tax=Hahella sp. HNIBRBA332 TaxID=3015983 RepID=UPI00273CDEAC|nr:XRE family transcriptional regulator [Hahella sp. HNIBRBA332]WLQ11267.1 XRE family transcriptional regulator [Hahella sp. HNIBRBA332]